MPGAMNFCSSSKRAVDFGPGQVPPPPLWGRTEAGGDAFAVAFGPPILTFHREGGRDLSTCGRGFSVVLDGIRSFLQVSGNRAGGGAPAGGERRPVV